LKRRIRGLASDVGKNEIKVAGEIQSSGVICFLYIIRIDTLDGRK
jgi:hypothetical protein